MNFVQLILGLIILDGAMHNLRALRNDFGTTGEWWFHFAGFCLAVFVLWLANQRDAAVDTSKETK
jgi:hypothetical protein